MEQKLLKISQVASLLNLNPKTLRYYDSIQLLTPSRRADNDYRLYSLEDVNRLKFIIRAKKFGFSLEEIRTLLSAAEQGLCKTVKIQTQNLLSNKLREIEHQISELQVFKKELLQLKYNLAESDEPKQNQSTNCDCL